MPAIIFPSGAADVRLLLFDLDGTLVDDRDRYLNLAPRRFAAMERRLGREPARLWARLAGYDPERGDLNMDGPTARAARREDQAIAASVICLQGIPWHRARVMAEEAYAEADADQRRTYKARLFEDVEPFLKAAKAAGFLLGVATNGQRSITEDLLDSLGIRGMFDAVAGSEDVKEPKPAPDLLLLAAGRAGVEPRDAVYVGDQAVDAEAAKAAGFGGVILRGEPSGITGIAELAVLTFARVPTMRES